MNAQEHQILRTEIQKPEYAANLTARNFSAVAATLNARTSYPNPVPRPQVPATFTWATFITLLTPAQVWGAYNTGGQIFEHLRSALENDRVAERNALWAAIKTQLPAQTITAVETAFSQTVPDPDWEPTLLHPSIAMNLGLPVVTAQDVQTVWQRVSGE